DSKFPEQALDIVELRLRPLGIGESPAQFLKDAAGALHVDLAGNFHAEIVAEVVAAHRPAERVGIVLGARRAVAAGLAGTASGPLLHLLGHALRALAQSFERAALGVDRTVGILLAERTLGVPHGIFGPAERFVALALLALLALLAELAAPAKLLQQFLELSAQRLLILLQVAELAAGFR